jgi:hypothetical protein
MALPKPPFKGATDRYGFRSYTTLQAGDQSFVYAQVAQKLVSTLTATAKPWMPSGVVSTSPSANIHLLILVVLGSCKCLS